MNALTKIDFLSNPIRIPSRAARAIGKPTFTTSRIVELTGDRGCYAELHCEVEFYEEFAAIPATRDEPGEPAQYDIASVRAYALVKDADGCVTTQRLALETPDWLESILIDLVDVDSLGADAESL